MFMTILETLREQKQMRMKGGLYHKVQIDLTYNSNHIEGGRLTHEQTRLIFETNTIGVDKDTSVNIDDIIETSNHFRCIDYIIDKADKPLTENVIKSLHGLLKTGTSDGRKEWFNVGEYKKMPNEVGGVETTLPENVGMEMSALLEGYNEKVALPLSEDALLDTIIDFHHRFECIHPFQDGNGRVGRLVMFKECLAHNIVPFIITDELRFFYYRGLREWPKIPGYLRDTCLSAQDTFKETLRYFRMTF